MRHEVRNKPFAFSSISWHRTKCKRLLLRVSISLSTVQGCVLVLGPRIEFLSDPLGRETRLNVLHLAGVSTL
jgi:hypothetical protein